MYVMAEIDNGDNHLILPTEAEYFTDESYERALDLAIKIAIESNKPFLSEMQKAAERVAELERFLAYHDFEVIWDSDLPEDDIEEDRKIVKNLMDTYGIS